MIKEGFALLTGAVFDGLCALAGLCLCAALLADLPPAPPQVPGTHGGTMPREVE